VQTLPRSGPPSHASTGEIGPVDVPSSRSEYGQRPLADLLPRARPRTIILTLQNDSAQTSTVIALWPGTRDRRAGVHCRRPGGPGEIRIYTPGVCDLGQFTGRASERVRWLVALFQRPVSNLSGR